MVVLLSSTYLEQNLEVELGKLPNCMVPLSNRKLFEFQLSVISKKFPHERVFIAIPDDFECGTMDFRGSSVVDVSIVKVPVELSPGEALLFVVNSAGIYTETLRVITGGCYVEDLPDGDDIIGLGRTAREYHWEIESYHDDYDLVWCGYYCFSDIPLVARCLTLERGDFERAVQAYAFERNSEKPVIDSWMDLSHINTYFQARSGLAAARSFNQISVQGGVLTKRSQDHQKIIAEGNWFMSVPFALKKYIPHFHGMGDENSKPFYAMEYMCALPLNEIYVHGRQSPLFWNNVFSKLASCLSDFARFGAASDMSTIDSAYRSLIKDKSITRLRQFGEASGMSLVDPNVLNGDDLPSLLEILEQCIALALVQPACAGFMHGDMCFSNILYDSRANAIKLIDPRGVDGSRQTMLTGNLAYDVAKFAHSVVGLYDHIIAGRFDLRVIGNSFDFTIPDASAYQEICDTFLRLELVKGLRTIDSMPIVITLFLSMLPLHSENPIRQKAFVANALRLYKEYVQEGKK